MTWVDIWQASLAEVGATSTNVLSGDELARARSFSFERDRVRFATGRAFLRTVLASYLDVGPQDIRFDYTERGKPLVAESTGVHFNVSHCEDVFITAVARVEVGIDVERIQRSKLHDLVGRRVLAPTEHDELRAIPQRARSEAFIRGWTRKEAYSKAGGNGLATDFTSFAIGLRVAPIIVVPIDGGSGRMHDWTFVRLATTAGYVATLASKATSIDTRYRSATAGHAMRMSVGLR
jgi:4'-phosphopantetheinyl transferase